MVTLGNNVIFLVREKNLETTKARELALVIQKLVLQYNQEIATKKLSKNKKTTKNREQRRKRRERAALKKVYADEAQGNSVGIANVAAGASPSLVPALPTAPPSSALPDSKVKSDINLSNLIKQQEPLAAPAKEVRMVDPALGPGRAPIVTESSDLLKAKATLPPVAVNSTRTSSSSVSRRANQAPQPDSTARRKELEETAEHEAQQKSRAKAAASQASPKGSSAIASSNPSPSNPVRPQGTSKGDGKPKATAEDLSRGRQLSKEPDRSLKKGGKASLWKSKPSSKAKGATRRFPLAQTNYFGILHAFDGSDDELDRAVRMDESSEYLEEDESDVESEVELSPEARPRRTPRAASKGGGGAHPNAILAKANSGSSKSSSVSSAPVGPPKQKATTAGKRK